MENFVDTVSGILKSADFWTIIIPSIAAILTWHLNEKAKLVAEQFLRKEERYKELVRSLRGFYIDSPSTDLKQNFINELNLCWLYASDNVIYAGYAFLGSVHTSARKTDAEKELLVGKLMCAIRCDLLSRRPLDETRLNCTDFQHLQAT